MDSITRRQFLETTAAGGGISAVALGGALAAEEKAADEKASSSPNSVVRIGVIGVRGRGNSQIDQYLQVPGAQVVALCDVDKSVPNGLAERLEAVGRHPVKRFTDLRKLFDAGHRRRHHRHAQPLARAGRIWACQAGKDVYVEKPGSHNICEGRQLVEAARKYNRIVPARHAVRSVRAFGKPSRSCAPA